MKDLAFIKTIAAAVVCGLGATIGLVLNPYEGSKSWLIGGAAILLGIVVAALPVSRGRAR